MSDSENGKEDTETTPPDVKEEGKEDQKKETSESKSEEKSANEEKKTKKTAKKEEVKEEEEEEEEDDDDGSEESEAEVGLLDRPVEVSGSRERKKVERLELNFRTPSKDKVEIPEGRGEKLGECPRIELKIQKFHVEELKGLHKLLFNRPGNAHEIKKNIRKFSGFTFTEGSAEYEKKKSALERFKIVALKHMCELLDIERTGLREEIILRILQFLLEPKSSGKAVPVSKSKKRSSTKGGKAKAAEKAEKGNKKGPAKKRKKTSDSDEEASDETIDKEEKEEEKDDEQDDVANESADSFEEPKKKKKGKPRKKKEAAPKEKKKERNGEKSKKSEDKKTSAKSAKRKNVYSSDDSESSDDGEPLAKKGKSPPSDDEIKQLVKKILDDADLEEITMKKVIKQVFDAYPDFDLSEKKDYIKATVKSNL